WLRTRNDLRVGDAAVLIQRYADDDIADVAARQRFLRILDRRLAQHLETIRHLDAGSGGDILWRGNQRERVSPGKRGDREHRNGAEQRGNGSATGHRNSFLDGSDSMSELAARREQR